MGTVRKPSYCVILELDNMKEKTSECTPKKGQHDWDESFILYVPNCCLIMISDIDLMTLVLQIDPLDSL